LQPRRPWAGRARVERRKLCATPVGAGALVKAYGYLAKDK